MVVGHWSTIYLLLLWILSLHYVPLQDDIFFPIHFLLPTANFLLSLTTNHCLLTTSYCHQPLLWILSLHYVPLQDDIFFSHHFLPSTSYYHQPLFTNHYSRLFPAPLPHTSKHRRCDLKAKRPQRAQPDLTPHQYTSNISGGTFLDFAIAFTYRQKRWWFSALLSLCAKLNPARFFTLLSSIIIPLRSIP